VMQFDGFVEAYGRLHWLDLHYIVEVRSEPPAPNAGLESVPSFRSKPPSFPLSFCARVCLAFDFLEGALSVPRLVSQPLDLFDDLVTELLDGGRR
jgi:hypothetical protein